jgi:cohesin complex subunit SA-1/2
MDLHILFCPSTTTGPDGTKLDSAPTSLSLDDEVQYRCAGFIQAEIERFQEHLEEMYPSPDDSDESDNGGGTETEAATKKLKKTKGKKQKTKPNSTSKGI